MVGMGKDPRVDGDFGGTSAVTKNSTQHSPSLWGGGGGGGVLEPQSNSSNLPDKESHDAQTKASQSQLHQPDSATTHAARTKVMTQTARPGKAHQPDSVTQHQMHQVDLARCTTDLVRSTI
ncbi:hypothetical protein Lal_00040400 [Lupinus albus]|nr:hypothetical protein Lal_00040400 [Lupinus albus]